LANDEDPATKDRENRFVVLVREERSFLALLLLGFGVCALTYRTPSIAMWVGFALAGYAAVANDSIQTIGTFIASNRNQKWWVLWLFIGAIWLATVTYSWVFYDGDVTYGRLTHKGFATAPTEFAFLQVAAPLFLLLLTRLRMPVSTSFLLLSCFATQASGVADVAIKSFAGYGVAFGTSIVVYLLLAKVFAGWFQGEPHPFWRPAQWVTSGLLWSVWIMQDAANVAVFLPRSLSVWQFLPFAGVVFVGLGVLFRMGGERVQEVVDEKSSVVDVRQATVIDLIYAVILYVFKVQSEVPMSTTWVFIGLLAGRELAMGIRNTSGRSVREALRLMAIDFAKVTIGLIVSVVLAYTVNESFRTQINALFG